MHDVRIMSTKCRPTQFTIGTFTLLIGGFLKIIKMCEDGLNMCATLFTEIDMHRLLAGLNCYRDVLEKIDYESPLNYNEYNKRVPVSPCPGFIQKGNKFHLCCNTFSYCRCVRNI